MSDTKKKLLGLFRSRSTAPPSSKSSNNAVHRLPRVMTLVGLISNRTGSASTAKIDVSIQVLLEVIADAHTAQEHQIRHQTLDVRLEFPSLHERVRLHHNL